MNQHPLSLLREELAVADAKAKLWRKLTAAAVAFSMFCLCIVIALVAFGGAYAQELRAYRLRCITRESAQLIVGLTTTLVKVNDQCFELHERNIAHLEETFPEVFTTPEGKRLRYMYEVADDKRREDVPVVPTNQAVGGGILQGSEAK